MPLIFHSSGVCWQRKLLQWWTSFTASSVSSWSFAVSSSHSPGSSSRGSRCIRVSSLCSSLTTPSSITPASCSKVSTGVSSDGWTQRVSSFWKNPIRLYRHPWPLNYNFIAFQYFLVFATYLKFLFHKLRYLQ